MIKKTLTIFIISILMLSSFAFAQTTQEVTPTDEVIPETIHDEATDQITAVDQEIPEETVPTEDTTHSDTEPTLVDFTKEKFSDIEAGTTPDQPFYYFFDRMFDTFQSPEEVAAERMHEATVMLETAKDFTTEEERREYIEYARQAMEDSINYMHEYKDDFTGEVADQDWGIIISFEQQTKTLLLSNLADETNSIIEEIAKDGLSEENRETINELEGSTLDIEASIADVFITIEEKNEDIASDIAEKEGREIVEIKKEIKDQEEKEGVTALRKEEAAKDFIKTSREIRGIGPKIAELQRKFDNGEELGFDPSELYPLIREASESLSMRHFSGGIDYDNVAKALGLIKEVKDIVDGKVLNPEEQINIIKTNIEEKKIKEIKEDYESKKIIKEKIETGELTTADQLELLLTYYQGENIEKNLPYDPSLVLELEQAGLSTDDAVKAIVKSGYDYNRENIQNIVRELIGNPEFTLPVPGTTTTQFGPSLNSLIKGDPFVYKQVLDSGAGKDIAAQVATMSAGRIEIEQKVRELTGNADFKLRDNVFNNYYYGGGGRQYDEKGNPIAEYDFFGREIDTSTGAIKNSDTFYSNYREADKYFYFPPTIDPGKLSDEEKIKYTLDPTKEILTSEDFSMTFTGRYSYSQFNTNDEDSKAAREIYRKNLEEKGWDQKQIDRRMFEISIGQGQIGGVIPGYAGKGDASPGALSNLIALTGSSEIAKQLLIQRLIDEHGESPAIAAKRVLEAESTFRDVPPGGIYVGGPYGSDSGRNTAYQELINAGLRPEQAASALAQARDFGQKTLEEAARQVTGNQNLKVETTYGGSSPYSSGWTAKDTNTLRLVMAGISNDQAEQISTIAQARGIFDSESLNKIAQEHLNTKDDFKIPGFGDVPVPIRIGGPNPEFRGPYPTTFEKGTTIYPSYRGTADQHVVSRPFDDVRGFPDFSNLQGISEREAKIFNALPPEQKNLPIEKVLEQSQQIKEQAKKEYINDLIGKGIDPKKAEEIYRIQTTPIAFGGQDYGQIYGAPASIVSTSYSGSGYTGGDPRAAEYNRLTYIQGFSSAEATKIAYSGAQGYSSGNYYSSSSLASVGTTITYEGQTYTVTADKGWTDSSGKAVPPPPGQPSSVVGTSYSSGGSGQYSPTSDPRAAEYSKLISQGISAEEATKIAYSGPGYTSSGGSYSGSGYYSGTPGSTTYGPNYQTAYSGPGYTSPSGSYSGGSYSGGSTPSGSYSSGGSYSGGSGYYSGGSYYTGSGEGGSYSGSSPSGSYSGGSYSGGSTPSGSYSGSESSGSYSGGDSSSSSSSSGSTSSSASTSTSSDSSSSTSSSSSSSSDSSSSTSSSSSGESGGGSAPAPSSDSGSTPTGGSIINIMGNMIKNFFFRLKD